MAEDGKSTGRTIRDRTIVAALIGAVATVGAAVVPRLIGDDTHAGPTQNTTISMTATETTVPEPHERLLSLLPPRASDCERAAPPFEGLARVKCTAASDDASVRLTFDLYEDKTNARLAFRDTVPTEVVGTDRVCPKGPDRSNYVDSEKKTVGQLACWKADDGQAYIVWTRDDSAVVAVLAGSDNASLAKVWPLWLDLPISGPEAQTLNGS